MSDVSFQSILQMPVEDIKDPVALPAGEYICIIDGQPQFAKMGVNQTDCVNFSLKPMQAQASVDAKALAEALDGKPLQDRKLTHRLFITEDSKHRLKKFLINDLGLSGHSLGEMIPEAMGKQVMVKVAHTSSQDGTTIYANVVSTAKV